MPNLLGLFYWRACRVSKLGATSNMKGLYAELIRLNGKCVLYQVSAFLLWVYARVPTAHSLRRNPPKISEDSVRWMGRQAVGTRAYTHKRKPQNVIITCISHSIGSILKPFILDVPPILILTLHAPSVSKTILTYMASIDGQINKLSRDI